MAKHLLVITVWFCVVGLGVHVFAEPKYTLDTFDTRQLDDTFYAEGASFGDLDGDGKVDLVAGPFWFKGPDFKQRHEIYPPRKFDPKGYSDNFLSYTHDIDGDDRLDVLVIGFPGKAARWYRNPGKSGMDEHWPVHEALDVVDNESPTFTDVTGDGQPEIVCMSRGRIGYASIPDKPTEPWSFTPISPKGPYAKFTHGLGVGDIDGDGRADILEKNGWWQQPVDWDGKSPWTCHKFDFAAGSRGGSQMLVLDADGDGHNDVVTSLNAHGYGFAWFQQQRSGDSITFKRHDIMTDKTSDNRFGLAFSQLHAMKLADMDGDGLTDIVTGKRYWAHGGKDPGGGDPPVVYWFKLTRTDGHVEFVPQPVHNDSGVGTQVSVGDVTGNGLPDIVVANKKGVFIHEHTRRQVSRHEWFWANHPAMKSVGKTPKQTAAGMGLPDGFESSLAVGEPDVHQPIAYTIDARGRLWVAENYSYPNWAPTGDDRIMIYEDADGDGYFEKSTEFYNKLNFVSGLEVGFGGVFVGSPPNLLFIPDRDGDDQPDGEPQVLLDGFGHQDTHETLNSFNWGPDGWLYGCHGVFTHSRVGKPGTPNDQRTPLNAGVWRYHPTRKVFEVFAHGTSNPWGVDFDARGECFITACVIPHAYHLMPGGRYRRQAGKHFNRHTYDDIKTIADHRHFAGGMRDFGTSDHDKAGGGHAHAGAMIYLGDSFPKQYRGKLFMNNIHGNRINMDVPAPQGSGFTLSHGDDFMLANDKWYRGLYLRAGPDGGVFASDWYDPRACHQQRPQDRSNGRIYKITYGKNNPEKIDLAKRSDAELVDLLRHDNRWHARTARRLLHERGGSDAVGEKLLKMLNSDGPLVHRLRALWALHMIERTDRALLTKLMDDGEPYIRAWAVRLAAQWPGQLADADAIASLAAREKSPVVRKYLAAASQRLPAEQRWAIVEALVAHSADADDANIPLLTWYAIEPLVAMNPARALQLREKTTWPQVRQFIVQRAASDGPGRAALVERLTQTEDTPQVRALLGPMRQALASEARAKMPDGWDAVYARLMQSEDAQVRDDARFLAVRFGDPRVFPQLRELVKNDKTKLEQRQAALDILVSGNDAEAAEAYLHALKTPVLRSAALRGLAMTDHPDTPAVVLKAYPQFNDEQRRLAIAALSARPTYARKLITAIGDDVVPREDVPVHAVRQMLEFNDDSLDQLISDNWGMIRKLSADKAEQMAKWKNRLTASYLATADLSHGREIFNQTCMACHTLFGVGGNIGPELTGSNRTDLDYVLENVLDPSADVGLDYQLSILTLKDGRVVSGMIRNETDTALTVQTADQQAVVDKSQVKNRQTLPTSMMPEGLFAAMSDADVRDLAAYLASPRQVPLPGQGPTFNPDTGRVDGAIEGESLKVVKVTAGNVRPQNMAGFNADRWSGDEHLWWINARPGDELTLAMPVKTPGKYNVYLAMTQARDYATVQLLIDGEPIGKPIDLFSAPKGDRSDVISTGPVHLGAHKLQPDSRLTVKITGANPDAEKRFMFAIDYLYLNPTD